VAEGCPGILLVDEAYAEFSGQDFTPLLAHANVLLLHTFSKLYAMAGVRVGYLLAGPHLARELQKGVSDFPLSVFAELTAEVALEHPQRFEPLRQEIVAERERLAFSLAQVPGVHVYPSATNFLLVQLGRPRQPLLQFLLSQHAVLLSDLAAYPELRDCVRISVGTPAQNDLVVRGFYEWSQQAAE
jgi:histidinol-phosphate aminotransferase